MAGTERLTEKQRGYVNYSARGMDSVPAARAAGYSPSACKKAASRLLKNPVVARAIESIRAEGRTVAVFGLVEAMNEAEGAAAFARKHKNPMALVKATELRAKLSGLLIDRIQEVPPVDLKRALEEARTRVLIIVNPAPGHSHDSATQVLTGAQPGTGAGPAETLAADGSPRWKPFISGD